MTTIGIILAFIFLDDPWRFIAVAGLLAFEVFEIMLWLRWRKKRSITGHETMVGMTGKVVTECDPEGQVRVKGMIWKARCPEGVAVGDEIVVTRIDGMRLDVAPVGSSTSGDPESHSDADLPKVARDRR